MATRNVSPEEASQLLAEGYVYVDVRTEAEFEAGHVPGAINVPVASPEFLSVMKQAFDPGEKLIVGCKMGGRSKKAADLLAQAGFTALCDMSAGWEGGRDAFGRPSPGWSKQGLPVETGKPAGQTYADAKQRKPRSA